jgi:hypothetical protein
MDRATAVAVSALTEEGILEGNPDGTFRSASLLNRAEFVKIVVGFLPNDDVLRTSCFPDVPAHAWYTEPVCRARAYGIVEGDARTDVPPEQWRFSPSRSVNYAEALKMLVETFAIPTIGGPPEEAWYLRYQRAAAARHLEFPGLQPTAFLNRGEMARLAAGFFAFSRGELSMLREAEREAREAVETRSSRSSSSSSSASSSPPQRASSAAASSVAFDPIGDVSTRGRIVLLNTVSPILGAVSIFSNAEPIIADAFLVTLSSGDGSVDSLLLYDQDQRLIGTARRSTGSTYRLGLKTKSILVPYREEYSFYVRADLKSYKDGGMGGELLAVSAISVEGSGAWSDSSYTQSATGTFSTHGLARSVITEIANAGQLSEPLVGGTGTEIGRFRFSGVTGDGGAEVTVTELLFNVSLVGGVTLSNVALLADGSGDRHSCSVSSSSINCSSIPESFGTLDGRARVLIVLADVTIPTGTEKAALQVSLNQAGDPLSPGAVRWTDGETTYQWVGFDSPIARGTYYSY